MKRLALTLALVLTLPLLAACPNRQTTALQVATVGHDAIATAQDLEANLCFGTPTAAAAIALGGDPKHCPAPTAATVGLTDAKHQQIAAGLAQAWSAYRTATSVAQTAGSADFTSMNTTLQSVLAIIATLQQSPLVTQLSSAVASAKK